MADIAIRQQSPTAFYIKVDPTDNVAIIVNDRGLTAAGAWQKRELSKKLTPN